MAWLRPSPAATTVGRLADGETQRPRGSAGFVGTVAGDGAWAAHGAGSTQASSKAMARIDGQAVLFFMTNAHSVHGFLDAIRGMSVPADTALARRLTAESVRQPGRLEVAAEIVPLGLRGDELVDRRVGQAVLDALASLRARTVATIQSRVRANVAGLYFSLRKIPDGPGIATDLAPPRSNSKPEDTWDGSG